MLSEELAELFLETLADREAGLVGPLVHCEGVVALHDVVWYVISATLRLGTVWSWKFSIEVHTITPRLVGGLGVHVELCGGGKAVLQIISRSSYI